MTHPLTANDTDRVEELFNVLKTENYVVDMAPPREQESMQYHPQTYENVDLGGYSLVSEPRSRKIDQEVHEALLDQSLEEFADIWRSLAQK